MKTNCFPNCSTFEQDHDPHTGKVLSDHFYCVDCGADERNVEAYWSEESNG